VIAYANVLLGNGDGTFHLAAAKSLVGGTGAAYLQAGDFNNDGRLDVVYFLGVLPGNGDGTLQDPPAPTSNVFFAGVPNPVGDFNGDGKLDLLTSDYQDGPFLQLGNGDGTFRQGRYLDVTGLYYSTVTGDVNADGKIDVVVLTNDFVLDQFDIPVTTTRLGLVLLGHGDGTFAPALSSFGTVPDMDVFESPVLADFNGDGLPDLASTETEYFYDGSFVNRGVHVMLNDGAWTLPPPPPPRISISNVTVTEGNIGTSAAAFTVTLSKPWDQPVTVAYATADGSATSGSDYRAVSGTLTIPAGQTTGTIIVLVNGDRLGELTESFVLNLSSPTNAVIEDGQGLCVILNDEPFLSISNATGAEGNKKQNTVLTFTVTLSAPSDQPVTVSFRTADGTASTRDGDYVARTGTLTFAPGETTKTITIEVKGDSKREGDETFYVDLFDNSVNSLFTRTRGIGTILNDD
jgi:hypothetical protein